MKRREFLSLLAGTVAPWPTFAFAQQNQAVKRIGLMANLPLPPVERFREKLQKLGWVEGKNLIIEYRYGEGRDDRFPEFAAELVSMPVDVMRRTDPTLHVGASGTICVCTMDSRIGSPSGPFAGTRR